ncbi:hypothetical protein DINM_002419 [Dirofilaria immitis]|nr:hypothetical protein [Dirofilaria immitis]
MPNLWYLSLGSKLPIAEGDTLFHIAKWRHIILKPINNGFQNPSQSYVFVTFTSLLTCFLLSILQTEARLSQATIKEKQCSYYREFPITPLSIIWERPTDAMWRELIKILFHSRFILEALLPAHKCPGLLFFGMYHSCHIQIQTCPLNDCTHQSCSISGGRKLRNSTTSEEKKRMYGRRIQRTRLCQRRPCLPRGAPNPQHTQWSVRAITYLRLSPPFLSLSRCSLTMMNQYPKAHKAILAANL